MQSLLRAQDIRDEAIEQGAYKKAVEAAKNMLADGVSKEVISKYVDLNIEELTEISNASENGQRNM